MVVYHFQKVSGKFGCIFSVSPQSRSLFLAPFQTLCFTARTYLNTQKYRLSCSLERLWSIAAIVFDFALFHTAAVSKNGLRSYLQRSMLRTLLVLSPHNSSFLCILSLCIYILYGWITMIMGHSKHELSTLKNHVVLPTKLCYNTPNDSP